MIVDKEIRTKGGIPKGVLLRHSKPPVAKLVVSVAKPLEGEVIQRWSQLFRQFLSVINGSLPPLVRLPVVWTVG